MPPHEVAVSATLAAVLEVNGLIYLVKPSLSTVKASI